MKPPPTYGATVRFSRHYGYDAAGRRSYMAYGNPATAVPTTNPTHQFSFDASGNRQSAVTPALGTVNYTSNNTNAYTMVTRKGSAEGVSGRGQAEKRRTATVSGDVVRHSKRKGSGREKTHRDSVR